MDKELKFDQTTLRIFYLTNKDYIWPVATLLLSLILLVFVVIPQFQEYISMQSDSAATQQRIGDLSKNIQTLNSINSSSLSDDFQTASTALPSEKDFIGVLQAVSKASANSAVSVGDFSFSVGDLSTQSAQASSIQPSLSMSLSLTGSLQNIDRFLQELSKASPIAEVSNVSINSGGASLQVAFDYKPLPQSLQVSYDAPLPIESANQKEIITGLRQWQNNVSTSSSFVSF